MRVCYPYVHLNIELHEYKKYVNKNKDEKVPSSLKKKKKN